MAQETRKDPRAKVLTMTVRYKSATVDEFIEHHSHDVSRGGIFIKTPSPFLPGTLLKFEIRIADETAMLQGVGRVVWKRDTAGTGSDKPAGMGVKFIKVDEASRNLIDRLVVSKGGGVSAFDDEGSGPPLEAPAAAQGPALAGPPRVSAPGKSSPPAAAAPRASGDGNAKANVRKATMIGLGAEAIAAAAAQPPRPRSSAPAAPAPAPMFPKTDSIGDMPPPEERTVMKQAAQLLEEALRGAGGSMEELGSPSSAEPPRAPRKAAEAEPEAAPPSGRAASPAPAERRAAPPATSHRASDGRVATGNRLSGRPSASQSPRADAAPALVEPSGRKKSGGKVGVSLLVVAGAAAVAYVAWQKQSPAPIDGPPPAAQAAAPPVTAAPLPVPTPAPSPAVAAAPADTAGAPVVSAAPAASAPANVAVKAPAAASATAPAAAAPRPVPVGETTPAAAPPEKPTPAPPPKPKAAPPKPAPPAGEEGATPAPPVEKKPKPAPAPKPSDDNPY
ncbi:MAG TPA: TIGR02266 family protein [Polyangiaceae bacterium]|nr:TIGR02266 family protein [Polyangiaceae bacterium]